MKKIILASASPRRKELLSALGFDFEIRIRDIDETCPDSIPAADRAIWIANKKAEAWRDELKENEILLCADTVVVLDDHVLNKPVSIEDAFNMLMALSGKTHSVITGVVVETKNRSVKASVKTLVTFNEIPVASIKYYLDQFKPLDKAGAYGIQEWIGHAFVSEIKGSYNNVVGLPTHEVYAMLKDIMN